MLIVMTLRNPLYLPGETWLGLEQGPTAVADDESGVIFQLACGFD
jgi:hypothetical protein